MAAATRAAPATATARATATATAPANAPSHLTTSFDSVSYINSHVLPKFECASASVCVSVCLVNIIMPRLAMPRGAHKAIKPHNPFGATRPLRVIYRTIPCSVLRLAQSLELCSASVLARPS